MVKEYYGQAIKHPETEYKQIEKLEKCQEMIIITRQYSKLFRSRRTRIIQRQDAIVEPIVAYNNTYSNTDNTMWKVYKV